MRSWRAGLQKHTIKYLVAALVAANCAGIFLANERLNRPYSGPSSNTPETVVDFADAGPAMASPEMPEPMLSSSAMEAERDLGVDAGPPPPSLAINDLLPELAALPPMRVESAPVIPSVAIRTARLDRSETRTARFRQARPQVEPVFDSAFVADYTELAPDDGSAEAASLADTAQETNAMADYTELAPYDGSAEAASLADTAQETNAMAASEVPSQAISIDSSTMPSPTFAGEAVGEAPVAAPAAQDVSTPLAEIPSVESATPIAALPG